MLPLSAEMAMGLPARFLQCEAGLITSHEGFLQKMMPDFG